eukprot:scaffold3764_cov50-Attheya_sp.AAC.4
MMGGRDLPVQRSLCTSYLVVLLLVVLLLGCQVEAFRKFKERFPADRQRSTTRSSTSTPLQFKFEKDPYEEQRRRELQRPSSPEEHLVTSLPLLEEGAFTTAHYAGHLPASPKGSNDKALFYWLFAPDSSDTDYEEIQDDAPLVIWLNGGPGCSSMRGLFLEHGPFRLVEDTDSQAWKMEVNPYSWHKAPAWMLYLDQPVGAGLSFTREKNYCASQDEINVDFYTWFLELLWLHSDTMLRPIRNEDGDATGGWEMQRALFFAGGGHAGIYIPSFIEYILKQNEVLQSRSTGMTEFDIVIKIDGAAIGNGSMDPYTQYNPSSTLYGLGFIGLAEKQFADDAEKVCQKLLDTGGRPPDNGETDIVVDYELLDATSQCLEDLWDVADEMVEQSAGDTAEFKLSFYNAEYWETKGESRTYPPGHKVVEAYLGGWELMEGLPLMDTFPAILENIHAAQSLTADQRYEDCSADAYKALEETEYEWMRGVTSEVEGILQNYPDIRLVFYNGMLDLICDHHGVERWMDRLKWDGHEEFTSAWRHGWTPLYEGPPVVYAKEKHQLSFLKIKNAGHFVPLEQPYIALEMIRRIMHGFFFKGYGGQDLNALDPEELKYGKSCPICQDCDPIAEKAVSVARIEDAASGIQNNNANSNNSNNGDTVNDVDDQYYYDDVGVSSWLWICGIVLLMWLGFELGRRGRDKQYDSVAMNNEVEEGNHFTDEDARLTRID